MRRIFHCLHGFLGQTSDWDVLARHLLPHESLKAYPIIPLDPSNQLSDDFENWATHFNRTVFGGASACTQAECGVENILIGYSLGGRLALHSLLDAGSQWDGAILVSTNPGLGSQAEKDRRAQSDGCWAQRFLQDPWESLLTDWDNQPVFYGQKRDLLDRAEHNYEREVLASLLVRFSLARQQDLRAAMSRIRVPMRLVCGSLDEKYRILCQEMALLNQSATYHVINAAAHRVPWEAPDAFARLCSEFRCELSETH